MKRLLFPTCQEKVPDFNAVSKIIFSRDAIDSSRILSIRIETPSHPCALLQFKERMIDVISFSVKEIESILLLILYSNWGKVLVLLIRVHSSTKNVLNMLTFSCVLVMKVPLNNIP